VTKRTLADPLRQIYADDDSVVYPVEFFVRGSSYSFFGIQTDLHLFGAGGADAQRINLLGTDNVGRDRFSRLLHAIRFSLIVCSIGVILACLIGIVIGIVSGYSTGSVDTFSWERPTRCSRCRHSY
jgi:peptide/nickel transport system permease protein